MLSGHCLLPRVSLRAIAPLRLLSTLPGAPYVSAARAYEARPSAARKPRYTVRQMASATGAGGAGAGATIDGSDTLDADAVWSFGFGSNMDVDALRRRKKVNVIRYTAAVLPKWKIAFSLPGLPYVEPGFALASRGGDDGTM